MKRGIYQDGYFKVSRRLLESSLWCESSDVLKVFLTLLALSQDPGSPRNGTVFIDPRLLAARCRVTDEGLDACLSVLSNPDERSRTQLDDGRRILVLPNGFRILNYGLYHDREKDEAISKARAKAGKKGGGRSAALRAEVQSGQQDNSKQTGKQKASNCFQRKQDGKETETETETTEQTLASRDAVVVVFDHWRDVMGMRSGSTKLTPERRRCVEARLKEYPLPDLLRAIDGCAASDFHMGRDRRSNPNGTKHNDLTLIFRNGSKVERFRDMAPQPGDPSGMADKYHDLAEWARDGKESA